MDIWTLNIFTLLVLALVGFFISLYITFSKSKTCKKGEACDKVVGSRYSHLFGLPVSLIALLFYGFLSVFLLLGLIFPTLLLICYDTFSFLLILSLLAGSFFSIYLFGVQAFILKSFCPKCISLAIVTILATILTFVFIGDGVIGLLIEHKKFILIFHVLGVALGLGGATITDLFFMRAISDHSIKRSDLSMMKFFSSIIWVGFLVLVVTGIGLYLPRAAELNHTPKFLVKVIGVVVILLNGLVLNFFITPKLTKLHLNEVLHEKRKDIILRSIVFASGAISLVSWYTVFLLGSLRQVNFSFSTILILYVAILLVAIIGSQIFATLFLKRKIEL